MKPRSCNAVFQRNSLIVHFALSALLLGCNLGPNTTSPGVRAVLGLYILTHVDGAPLPSPPAAPGSADPCPPAVTDGEFSLIQGPRTPQLYTLSVAASRACDPGGIPSDATGVLEDGGGWSISGNQISFTSSPSNGHGSYRGTVDSLSPEPIVSVPFGGHTYTFRRLDPDRDQSAGVAATIVDESGAPVPGALIVFHSSNGQVERGFSGTTKTPFAVPASLGTEVINIGPPSGYTFAPGQSNPVEVEIKSGQLAQVTVLLMKTTAQQVRRRVPADILTFPSNEPKVELCCPMTRESAYAEASLPRNLTGAF